jgi:hypothetical protein
VVADLTLAKTAPPVVMGAVQNGPRPTAAPATYTGPAPVRVLPIGMRGKAAPAPIAPADAAALAADLAAEEEAARLEAVAHARRAKEARENALAFEQEQLAAAYERHYDRTHDGE